MLNNLSEVISQKVLCTCCLYQVKHTIFAVQKLSRGSAHLMEEELRVVTNTRMFFTKVFIGEGSQFVDYREV